MNWLHFLSVLAGAYCLYYLTVILLDVAAGKRNSMINPPGHELTFSENVVPAQLIADTKTTAESSAVKTSLDKPAAAPKKGPEMIGSGGVVIDNLFKLCKQEAIIFTRAVSF